MFAHGLGPARRQLRIGVQDQQPGRLRRRHPAPQLPAAGGSALDPDRADRIGHRPRPVARPAIADDDLADQAGLQPLHQRRRAAR
ncbi:hypothetical protein ATO9_04745 [Pseudooceanicola atlanticus]|uniref:Uncharacterized protein n=1 Tax=Pseudooceanicola atlanticus TaxID=1461694 RepID=A0A0A0EEI7_9RHOB|nr:hypothetical protein ATO9_04745 [Pseudooceanicola atlanticus]